MTERSRSFGAAAAAYERFRPGYPAELVEAILDYADAPVRTALEIGAGTGKATRAFTDAGIAVTATEPDAAMLAVLREAVPSARPVEATLEGIRPDGHVDLVFCAAALHWTEPTGRWDRVAALLRPGGTFASFGGPAELADEGLQEVEQAARAPWLVDDDIPSPDGEPEQDGLRWPGTELASTPLFDDVREVEVPRRFDVTREEYVGLLGTVSAYLVLPEADRNAALDAVRRALPAQVEVNADLTVHLARRAPDPSAGRGLR